MVQPSRAARFETSHRASVIRFDSISFCACFVLFLAAWRRRPSCASPSSCARPRPRSSTRPRTARRHAAAPYYILLIVLESNSTREATPYPHYSTTLPKERLLRANRSQKRCCVLFSSCGTCACALASAPLCAPPTPARGAILETARWDFFLFFLRSQFGRRAAQAHAVAPCLRLQHAEWLSTVQKATEWMILNQGDASPVRRAEASKQKPRLAISHPPHCAPHNQHTSFLHSWRFLSRKVGSAREKNRGDELCQLLRETDAANAVRTCAPLCAHAPPSATPPPYS